MRPTDKIDNLIKKLKTSASADLDRRIDALLAQSPAAARTPRSWRIPMKTTAKYAAAAMIAMAFLIFYNTADSKLYAQVIKAMEKAKTIYAVGYHFQDGQMVKDNEIWYKQNIGFKMVDRHKETTNIIIDNGQSMWKYREGSDFAIKSRSVTTENLPRELTDTTRYLDKCIKDENIDLIDGISCQVYIGSYPSKPESTRVMLWVDKNLLLRRFEEKVFENGLWKTVERVDIEYNGVIDDAVFSPDFGTHVVIIEESLVLDKHFSLDNVVFTKEEMGLIFAVHEIKRCQDDLIYTVTSLRPTEETKREIASRDERAWNYGDYQFGSCYEYNSENNRGTSYQPVELAWFYQNGLVIRWTAFIPHGFESGQVDQCKMELYYLYTCGKMQKNRMEAGLPDRNRFKPIAVLPLPDTSVNLETQLKKTYDCIKLLEPMTAEKHLQLTPVPFTDEEMEEQMKQMPNDGITKQWKAGDKTSRLYHGQTKKPSQIDFDEWLEDRLAYIEQYRNL